MENKMNKTITSLYEHYKNSPKKLKIICDWDEVIQSHEPYALWKAISEVKNLDISKIKRKDELVAFQKCLNQFWSEESCPIVYSPYVSKISGWIEEKTDNAYFFNLSPEAVEKQTKIKNSPNFYSQAPFLTIAEDLLKLIKEDKVEKLIFLSAYDKRKFPYGDERKEKIFKETFYKVGYHRPDLEKNELALPCYLELIPFDSETQGQSKVDWIKENTWDYDIFIDDNPLICKEVIKRFGKGAKKFCDKCMDKQEKWFEDNKGKSAFFVPCENCFEVNMKIIAPCYPAIENQHHKEVLLVKNEISDLNKEDF